MIRETNLRDPQVEAATPGEWAAYQDDLTCQAVLQATVHTWEVGERLEKAGVAAGEIRGVGDLGRVPVLSKDDLPALQAAAPPFGGMVAVPVSRLRRIFQSPGPIFDPEGDPPDFWRWQAALWAAGLRPGNVVYNTFSYHLTPAGAMMEEGLLAIGCTVVPGGVGNTDAQVDFLARVAAVGYTGTPDFLHTLVERAAQKGLELGLRRAFVSGGPLPPALRRTLENDYGLAVYQGYGTADAGAIGYECETRNGWHVAPGTVVEIVDPATGQSVAAGQTGEVVVTVPSDVYPLVRFGTGDLSALDPAACACGRTTPRLLGWQGRVGDGVKVRGMFVHGRQLAEAFAKVEDVERYQAVVSHDAAHKDQLTVRVAGDAERLDADEIAAWLRGVLKLRTDVEVVSPASIDDDAAPLVDARRWDEDTP